MDKKSARDRAKELRDKLNVWNREYFELDSPSVSDAVFDTYFEELKYLEQKYRDYFSDEELSNSPTQLIGASKSKKFTKYLHSVPMLSLNKAYTRADLERYINHIGKTTKGANVSFFIEPKIDGISLALHYKHGRLFRALTRGNGEVGEDVTHNVLVIENIPTIIEYDGDLEVRGEVFVSKTNFEKVVRLMAEQGQKIPANPRNLASGSLRQLDSNIAKQRCLEGRFFNLVFPLNKGISTHVEAIQFLAKNNFPIIKIGEHCATFEDIERYLKKFEVLKDSMSFPSDGAVIKLNEYKFYEQVGYTSSFPHHSIAFKFKEISVLTTVEDIFPTVGRTGIITYNAKLKPVQMSGTIVSAATLHNWNYVNEIGLNIGDVVEVKKAGDIIPRVVRVVEKVQPGVFDRAQNCPNCNNLLVLTESGADQFCIFSECTAKIIRSLIHFCSKECMDIKTLSDKSIETFFVHKLLTNFSDIYKLKEARSFLESLPGQGPQSIKVLLDSIEESKTRPLWRLINALGIERIGKKMAKLIAIETQTFERLLVFDFNQLLNKRDVGKKIVSSLINYFSSDVNRKQIQNLLDLGLNLRSQVQSVLLEDSRWKGKTFVITGTHSLPRAKLQSIIEEKGGIVTGKVTQNTNFLVLGEKPGIKLQQAQKLNVTIISEDLFLKN